MEYKMTGAIRHDWSFENVNPVDAINMIWGVYSECTGLDIRLSDNAEWMDFIVQKCQMMAMSLLFCCHEEIVAAVAARRAA
ncbi:hypothetical protein FDI24_gp170 [Acidovorax phage ACP17]|uniref:Uncharacterized protein n=1 Tax=Acidovorax phage ACP17 TaxID=2010329 RepID=A0A218M382_9CAUD|nr:hypothetical protein FDI24_gp170 [Acidovorax phage ACP17]ASD50506.2 hypothetical protein [Acidovorax phage ACP17]